MEVSRKIRWVWEGWHSSCAKQDEFVARQGCELDRAQSIPLPAECSTPWGQEPGSLSEGAVLSDWAEGRFYQQCFGCILCQIKSPPQAETTVNKEQTWLHSPIVPVKQQLLLFQGWELSVTLNLHSRSFGNNFIWIFLGILTLISN